MRSIFATALVIITGNVGQTPAALLKPGDIAFLGYGSSTAGVLRTDTFRFLALAELPSNVAIFFTDEELPLGAFEGRLRYSTSNTIAAGAVIEIRFDSERNMGTATFGTVTETDPGFDLNASGDGLIAYLGTSAVPTTFLSALNYSPDSLGDLTGTGLTLGLNAVDALALTPRRKAEYQGPRKFANVASARAAIHDLQNWVGGDDAFSFQIPTGTDVFTLENASLSLVPEPSALIIWSLFGVASLGITQRQLRRRRRETVAHDIKPGVLPS